MLIACLFLKREVFYSIVCNTYTTRITKTFSYYFLNWASQKTNTTIPSAHFCFKEALKTNETQSQTKSKVCKITIVACLGYQKRLSKPKLVQFLVKWPNMVKTSGKANCRKHPIDMMVKNAIKTYFSSELLLFYWHKKNLSIRKILLSEINPYLMGNCLLFILFSFKEDYSFKRYFKEIEKKGISNIFLCFIFGQTMMQYLSIF